MSELGKEFELLWGSERWEMTQILNNFVTGVDWHQFGLEQVRVRGNRRHQNTPEVDEFASQEPGNTPANAILTEVEEAF